MALLATPDSSRGILGSIKGALGLFSNTNKAQGVFEPNIAIPIDEYESSLKEDEILLLIEQWKKSYAQYYAPIDETQKLSFDYWVGLHKGDDLNASGSANISQTLVDNKIFESLETFLPIATRANPDPLVQADPSDDGQRLARAVKEALVYLADKLMLRRKLARMLRHWALYRLGCLKISWDPILKQIRADIINTRRLIFDKDGFMDEGGKFVGEYIGEKKKATAQVLTEMFPKKEQKIIEAAQGKMGTKLDYYEWWYRGEDVFFTLGSDCVLGKFKNPNWNYDIQGQEPKDALVDEEGNESSPAIEGTEAVEGKNHLKRREFPYVFLSVFNVGLHPHDETSLILQNITLQDLVNRRLRQIDQNIEGMNNGIIVSEDFTEEQAAQAANAKRKGKAIRVPTKGDIRTKIDNMSPNPLPRDIFQQLEDARQELRSVFGTGGSTPEAMQDQDTVRGKIMVSQQDSSRIGGGITEQLEQVADTIYNWFVQMMFVYYDEPHYIVAAGSTGGADLITIRNTDFQVLQTLDITVKEGSLVPKDPLTQRNEAIDLWGQSAIDPLTFYKRLDFPDPVSQTQQLMLWQMYQKGQVPPQAYLPSFQIPQEGQQVMQQQQQAMGQGLPGTGGPAVNPPGNQGVNNPQSSEPPEQAVARQLIQSVPIPK